MCFFSIRNLSFCFMVICVMAVEAQGFVKDGCGSGECRECHELNKKDAAKLLSVSEASIMGLKFSEVPGLWEVDVRQQGKVLPLFIDFSKQYLISGSVIKIADKQNITKERFAALNRIDISQIPLDDALMVGNPEAKNKIIVFDDPQCPFCAKLQKEMKEVVALRADIAFFIKMYPLKSHPQAYELAKAIVCAKSLAMLEESLAGKPLAPATCETNQIDKNMELADKIGIRSTPTLVFPDGRVVPGYKPADSIIRLLEAPSLH